jgi:DNA/RNA-binding domain of Phe-tRNA-synthetase-like protein
MEFIVADECRQLGLRARAVVFRDVRVTAADAGLRAEIAREVEEIRRRFDSAARIRAVPEVQHFQEILRRAGVSPRKFTPSLERLLTMALRRGDLPPINTLVDAYNLASVRTLCSLGAHDVDRLTPPVTLRLLTGEETFTPLGQTTAAPVVAGEFGYVDDAGRVLCRLDVLQADFSKVTIATTRALLIVEGTVKHSAAVLESAIETAIELVTRYCGGTATIIAH